MRGIFFRTLILLITTIIFFGCSILNNVDSVTIYNYKKYFAKESFLKQIKMPDKLTLPKNEITVAVIDMGMDLNHPAYKKMLVKSDFKAENAIYPNDEASLAHGTAVASIIASQTDKMIGIAPNVKILPVLIGMPSPKGFEDIATTYYKINAKDMINLAKQPEKLERFKKFIKKRTDIFLKNLAEAIRYATDNGAKIICSSLTTKNETKYVKDAVEYAHSKGVVIIMPTGNDAKNLVYYPAKFDDVIGVGGVNQEDKMWYEEVKMKDIPMPIKQGSNYGKGIDVVAPCCNILHAYPKGFSKPIYQSDGCGTSLAAPQVAGLAALILSKNPNLTPEKVKDIIIKGADDIGGKGWDEKFGYGRINIKKSLEMVK